MSVVAEARYPTHDRKHFYKYTTASTAMRILDTAAVLYRSPLEFNDPFDVQSGLHFDFTLQSLPDIIFDRIDQLVSLDTKPIIHPSNPFGELVNLMWANKSTYGYPGDAMRTASRPFLASLAAEMAKLQNEYQNKWWNDFLPRLRVFCVSEVKDNLLMWSHYANDHKGVVLKFRVLPELDNPLCVAGPVQYRSSPPPLFTAAEWLDDLFDVSPLNVHGLYMKYAYIKSDVWGYEKEWRVWDLLAAAEIALHTTYPLKKDEIAAIYFGCRTADDERRSIIQRLKDHPNVEIFQATKSLDKFKLDFDRLE